MSTFSCWEVAQTVP